METTTSSRPLPRLLVVLTLLAVLAIVLFSIMPAVVFTWVEEKLSVFATVFLGIFIEALPYLALGTLASGLVEVFVDQGQMARFIPRTNLGAAFMGAMLGLAFPVCECGVIPLTRRLFHKGLPLSAGISFLLAAPVLNPIVILSTAAAFGWGRMLLWRLVLTLAIAILVGLVFSVEPDANRILQPFLPVHEHDEHDTAETVWKKIRRALVIGADEFFDMGRYLVIGAMLAAAMQTFLPQGLLLAIGNGPLTSVLVMIALAFVLSICSTVDALVALGFVGSFSFGAVLSFLVFGPMMDIKSLMMYRQVFRPRAVMYLVLLPFLTSLLAGLIFNYWLP